MSPILDLQNITPISLEDLGESKQEDKKIDNTIDSSFIIENKEETKEKEIIKESPEKKKLIIKKKDKKNTIRNNSKIENQIQNSSLQASHSELLLSIKECEVLSGISKVSIRKAIKEKEINYLLEDGKYKIPFKELLKWCYASTRRKNVLNTSGIGRYVNQWNIII